MSTPILAGSLREPVGWVDGVETPSRGFHNRVAEIYFPRILRPSGEVKLPHRDASLLNLKCSGVRLGFLHSMKGSKPSPRERAINAELAAALTRDLGIPLKDSRLFLSRGRINVRRTEEEIKGIIDSLLLFDVRIFGEENGRRILMDLLRKIIKVSTYNVDTVTKQWKNFTNFVWIEASKSETLEPPTLSIGNIFKRLFRWDYLARLVSEGIQEKRDCENLAHLISTRHLVAGGKSVLRDSLRKFKETVTSGFIPEEYEYTRVNDAGYSIGRKIRGRTPDFIPDISHISLTSAGSYESPVSQGGRFKILLDQVKEILTQIPGKTGDLILPLGFKAQEVEGIPRWKTWCRDEILTTDLELGEEREEFVNDFRYWGLDEAFGQQVFRCALLEAFQSGYIDRHGTVLKPIPARTLPVPEPGGKSRIVTTSLWWVTILQQPGGHYLRAALRYHPSAESGLERTDQAWNYLSLLRKVTQVKPEFAFLSSDLEEATDALVPSLVKTMTMGFLDGLGVSNASLLKLGLELVCSSRLIEYRDKDTVTDIFITKRGILMGEPMTKSLLTLYNLCCEERALHDYFAERGETQGQVNWRAFAVGGDDHIAYGPKDYLYKITGNHLLWGSKISKTKHAISGLAVRYCEKVLFFKERDFKISQRDINLTTDNYLRSVFVDSIKVRLLSPISKSIEVRNDRNIAIGKAITLGRTLRWLNRDQFPDPWIKMVRTRFFRRMGHYLPKEGTNFYYQTLLPQEVGGLDLYLPGELGGIFRYLPSPSQYLIWRLLEGDANPLFYRRVQKLASNGIERGIRKISPLEYIKIAFEKAFFNKTDEHTLLQDEGSVNRSISIFEARDREGISLDLPMRSLIRTLKGLGYMTCDDLITEVMRGELFQSMLTGKGDVMVYSTIPWKTRFSHLWDELVKLGLFSEEMKAEVRNHLDEIVPRVNSIERISRFIPLLVRNVDEIITYPMSYDEETGEIMTLRKPPLEVFTYALPTLKLEGLIEVEDVFDELD